MINNQTQFYISVSKKPGNFGASIYNRLFAQHGINAIYLPRQAGVPIDLIQAIKSLNVYGCSVSTPLKGDIVPFLDEVDPIVEKTGVTNTIVNQNGLLKGFNTDYYGVQQALIETPAKVLVYGAGSVTNSIVQALKDKGVPSIYMAARHSEKAQAQAKKHAVESIELLKTVQDTFDLVINATPASAEEGHEIFGLLEKANSVFDLVVAPEDTLWIQHAIQKKLLVVRGIEMSKYQLQKQFEIYTGKKIDIDDINQIIYAYYYRK